MITAEELIQLNDNKDEQKCFKLGTVVELFDDETAKIQFDGEDAPSEKEYAYLDSYVPAINDRVLLCAVSDTYIILGKIKYNEAPTKPEEVDRYVFDEKQVNVQKGLNVTNGINTDSLNASEAEVSNNLKVDGTTTANSISSGGDITANGNVNCTNLSASNNISAQEVTANNVIADTTLRANYSFYHAGSWIAFFGASGKRQIAVSNVSDNADLNGIRSALSNLISALKSYGLIG